MIPIAKPFLGEEEAQAAHDAVLSGWVSQGPQVAAFEAEFAEDVGAPHACAVSNCTTALHLACLGLGIGPGDEVITVSHSFIAGANAIRQCGAIPIFVDIEPGGFNIDLDATAAAITSKTRAILCVHQIGMPCDLPGLLAIAQAHNLPLIEDAACAIGSEILIDDTWQAIGRPHGDVACFSFHPRKVITTGEGGMLTTRDAALDARFRLWRQHSMSVSDTARHAAREIVFEDYPELGYNYRMTDIQAAVGRVQLKRLPEIVRRRREIAAQLTESLADIHGAKPPVEPPWARSNWQSYCVTLDPDIDQKRLMQAMLDRGVATRRGIMCMHLEESQADLPMRHDLRRSTYARDHSVLLPVHPLMTDAMVQTVVDALREAVPEARSTVKFLQAMEA
ncbi:dTDP-4-amino-4,6-dideoxygalactose transaminase [Jannaschia faecimaris]|uniref:dTDP-4-amino-4,6-dideoxygalactose transaminase n=1 Tax=Jannaschia faecimaris TaxID=1244108 RepID=A0A1H3JBZ6_9RHOB|nr:DegT/DnrJ/EryC1/StrS family aminotransferase [Jannaschia faecimaris]SDY36724.1 dTDP-4-amino-4,6-dideoxygalactose transaminase [Jannaschia faecimaris]